MNKYLKYGLYTAGGALVLFVGALAYLALTFDPNTYKPQIIQAVQDSKHRTLQLDGDIKLFFFPNIGVHIGKVSLSEFKSEQEFAAIGEAKVSLAFMPLLSKKVVVNEVVLKGVRANVIKYKNGKTNLDDLLANDTATPVQPSTENDPAAPVMFDISSVRIENAELGYLDESTGAQYAVKDLSLKTGRIANGVPSKIEFSTHVQANQPKVDISAQINTTLTFDLEKSQYKMQHLDVQAKGALLDISDLALKLSGDADAKLESREFAVTNLFLTASGLKAKEKFNAKLVVPGLSFQQEAFSAINISFDAQLDAAFGNITASMALPSMSGGAEIFKLSDLAISVDLKQPEQAFKFKLTTPIAGNLKTQQFNLSNLVLAVNATSEKLPGKSVSSELKGSVQADVGRQSIQANLVGGLLQSQIKAKFAVNNFASPAIRYDLEIDQFDADPYIPKSAGNAKPVSAEPEQAFDLSALKGLNLEGSVRIGALKAANVKVNKLRVDVKAKNGLLKIDPFSANLYGGSIASNISIDAGKSQPEFAVNAKLNGIEIGPLLKDALELDFVSGKGSVGINVTTQGNRVSLLKKNVNGTLSVNLADGAVKGINLAKSAREMGKGGDKTQGANKAEQTDFSELKASFKISNGVARNDDLSLKSPFVRVGGKGEINLGNDSLDYLVKATLAGTAEGQGGKDNVGGLTVPVRLSGPYTDLKYKFEFGSMVSDAAKQKAAAATDAAKQKAQQAIDAQKEQAKAKVQQQLQQGLKGLLK